MQKELQIALKTIVQECSTCLTYVGDHGFIFLQTESKSTESKTTLNNFFVAKVKKKNKEGKNILATKLQTNFGFYVFKHASGSENVNKWRGRLKSC